MIMLNFAWNFCFHLKMFFSLNHSSIDFLLDSIKLLHGSNKYLYWLYHTCFFTWKGDIIRAWQNGKWPLVLRTSGLENVYVSWTSILLYPDYNTSHMHAYYYYYYYYCVHAYMTCLTGFPGWELPLLHDRQPGPRGEVLLWYLLHAQLRQEN